MAKTSKKITAPIVEPAEEILKLDEYCSLRSKTDRRIELLSGFQYHAIHELKITSATKTFYDKAFENFVKAPA